MNVFISGITSDIGMYICKNYMQRGAKVFGTYRKLPNKIMESEIIERGGYFTIL